MIKVFAPAKVNLTLHVTGQREDGYHLLDSLVCFPDIGDRLSFSPAEQMSLTIKNAPELSCGEDNLVMKAARRFLDDSPQSIELFKKLPIASGIGGGSANAAAVLRAAQLILRRSEPETLKSVTSPPRATAHLTQDGETPPPVPQEFDPDLFVDALTLGADVPVCLSSRPARMRGIGDQLSNLTFWPDQGHILLINPGVGVSTPEIFNALPHKDNAPMPANLPQFSTLAHLIEFIETQRNDLQGPAIAQQHVIADVIDEISATSGCLIARMSGSGATCFGIYAMAEEAVKAGKEISKRHSNWWIGTGALQH